MKIKSLIIVWIVTMVTSFVAANNRRLRGRDQNYLEEKSDHRRLQYMLSSTMQLVGGAAGEAKSTSGRTSPMMDFPHSTVGSLHSSSETPVPVNAAPAITPTPVSTSSPDIRGYFEEASLANAQADLTFCCSWDLVTCGTDEWCNLSSDNCRATCGGSFIDPTNSTECTPRWSECTDSATCCGDAFCMPYLGTNACLLPGDNDTAARCCSWDLATCGDDFWCSANQSICEGSCSGSYIDPSTTSDCIPRWEGCSFSEQCCGSATCIEFDGYMRCGLPRDEEPAETPVFIPTPVPQTITPSNPPRMSSRSPVDQGPAPTLPPVQPTPTINFGPIPLGPFITCSSERITIPDPPVPVEAVRQNCPHLDFDLLDWEDAGTWGGVVPTTGDVQLPDNSRVIIRQSVSGVLGVIKIPETSELVIGENPDGITLDVGGIDVQGKLTAGSETCRLTTTVTITLHGSRPNDAAINIRDGTYKGISVTGEISLHGKRFYRTWTRLAKSVLTGDTVLMLQHQVNWQPGQSIILVTTAMKDSREWHQNEVHIVIGVVVDPTPGVGAAVYLKRPVQHTHVANSGYQAEVGLLTRSIKIQGAAGDSEPIDPDPLNCRDSDRNMHGDQAKPCPNTELTGFGGHVIVYGNGMGYVEGVELFRMGQTNVLGRYPMHFHLLGDSCQHCYFRESSVHHSFYRCVSIHGTNYINVNENVAFDVTGYCYYLEDGVEHDNTISFNLAAHIHLLGPEAPWGDGQTTGLYQQSDILTLPADVTASGFYITNVQNNIIGNAASGGWSGFAFPNLPSPLGHHRDLNVRPSSALPLTIDGNTAHSTGWWWSHAGGFYFGGALYYTKAGLLEYNPGRDFDFNNHGRNTCNRDLCLTGSCGGNCEPKEQLWLRLTNTKAFLVPSVGLSSWSGRMEIVGFEAHDVGLSIEALAAGFWIDDMLAVCRTGSDLALPPGASASSIPGHGFFWYDDTDQEHIITSSTFRRCGYRSEEFIQYDGPTRGCGDDDRTGCWAGSTVFGFLTHSDEFNPEIMQGTKKITFENCGRRFKLDNFNGNSHSTVSGRLQNWFDADGSVTGLGVPSLIGSGLVDTGLWWKVDDDVVYDPQGPLNFIQQTNGPQRGLGHVRIYFDDNEHNQVGGSQCGNGEGQPCNSLGFIRHMGKDFSNDQGLSITANGDIDGPVGGFSWFLTLNEGAPKQLRFDTIEVDPDTPLLFSIAYPPGTNFTVRAQAAYCNGSGSLCQSTFTKVDSIQQVRQSLGNVYSFSDAGLLTVRIVQTAQTYLGDSEWFLPTYESTGRWDDTFSLPRFERGGVRLPMSSYGPYLEILAECSISSTNWAYCAQLPPNLDPDVCPSGYVQVAYDRCCINSSPKDCVFANGLRSLDFWS